MSKLGRDLTKTLIIDNVADNFQLQPLNGIHIKNFEGDENDTELLDLTEDLVLIAKLNLDDIRDHLHTVRNNMIYRNKIELRLYDKIQNTKSSFEAEIDESKN